MNKKMKRTWQRLTSDKRRFGLFCGLLFVGLLLWARIIVIARPARTAVAQPVIESEVVSILASDKVFIPVVMESEPNKNPFAVSAITFPEQNQSTDNNSVQDQSTGTTVNQNIIASFELEAIMGNLAMINGQVVKIGDTVGLIDSNNPLYLEVVNSRSVIISDGNHRYEISIAPPRR